jgi:hypothetical protein
MRTRVTIACAAMAFVAIAGGSAEATGLIRTANIANGAITFGKLSPHVQQLVSSKGTGTGGVDGATGATGATGASGLQGVQGAKGATGAQGPAGPSIVAAGIVGPTGDKGDQGVAGPQGAAGADSDATRAVTSETPRGFVLAPDGDNTPAFGGTDAPGNGTTSFVSAAGAPLGTGALDMTTVTGKSVAAFLPAAGAKGRLLSELTSFGYASKVIAQPAPANDVTAQIEVTGSIATHFSSGYTTVVFEPYVNGESGLAGWHRSDVVHGKVWSTQALSTGDCSQAVPCAFSTFVAENPRAIVLDAKFRIGQNSGTPAGDGGEYLVDDVIYGFGTTVNYDLGA